MRTEANRSITIMGLLAECSTNDAKVLLKKYGISEAKNNQDLEFKLAKLYKNCSDKKQLEKDFAEIHPHKDFMKKYLLLTPPPKTEVVVEKVTEIASVPEIIKTPEIVSNCDGGCSCKKDNFSGANGLIPTPSNEKEKLIVYGMFGIISILALVLISKQK